jgi:hypothetical protein
LLLVLDGLAAVRRTAVAAEATLSADERPPPLPSFRFGFESVLFLDDGRLSSNQWTIKKQGFNHFIFNIYPNQFVCFYPEQMKEINS